MSNKRNSGCRNKLNLPLNIFPFNKTSQLKSPVGPLCFSRWQGIMRFLAFNLPRRSRIRCACPRYAELFLNTMWLSSIRCTCPRYTVPVFDTLCLSSIRRTCPRYAVPVLDTLSCPFAVPVLNTLFLFSIRCACRKYVELAFRCACSY